MRLFLLLALGMMLLQPALTMDAASRSCRLFVSDVLPGLFPYMTLSQLLISRLPRPLSPAALMLAGWGGGSPAGAQLLRCCPEMSPRARRCAAVSCATMSPMFLWGTLGEWLDSPRAGGTILLSVILGGWLAGRAAGGDAAEAPPMEAPPPLRLGQAVEQTARTMLLVCGTMALLRVLAALGGRLLPGAAAVLTTALEVTAGAKEIAALPLPLPLRTAMLAGVTGFGGAAVMLQNRALYPPGLLPLPRQLLCQALHGALSFGLAQGLMLL